MTAPDSLDQLKGALDGLAAALESGRPDAVLAAEEPLVAALGAFTSAGRLGFSRSPELLGALNDVRLAVARCKLLGRSSADLLTAMFPQQSYGPPGSRSHFSLPVSDPALRRGLRPTVV